MNEIIHLQKTFKKEGLGQIRIAKLDDKLMFNLYDTCFYLGYTKIAKGKKYLRNDKIINICGTLDIKGLSPSDNFQSINSGTNFQNTWITEQSFYDLCLESHAKNARPFRRWVTGEVLPSIRKTGFYSTEKVEQLEIQEPYKLVKKFYNGNPVMTLKDLEFLIGTSVHTIGYILKSNNNFAIGTNYFLLEGRELKKFKKDNELSPWIGSLIVIPKQGVDKLLNLLLLKPAGELRETFERYFELENQVPQSKNKAPILEQLQACKFIADDMKVGEAVKMSIYKMICEKNGIDTVAVDKLKSEYSKKLDKKLLEVTVKYMEFLLDTFTTEGIITLKEETIAEEPIIAESKVVKKVMTNLFNSVIEISKKDEKAVV
jgi:prophage antirepressor-like protein